MAGGFSMNVTIPGLAAMRSRMGRGAATLDAELKPALRQSAEEMKQDARTRAKGNILPNSVQFESREGGLTYIIGSVAKTALSIEQGRKAGENVPVGPITSWMNRNGIVSTNAALAGVTQSIRTHKVNTAGKRRAGIRASQRDLAWKIVMAIHQAGTKALPFIIPVAQANREHVQKRINDAVGRALHKVARGN